MPSTPNALLLGAIVANDTKYYCSTNILLSHQDAVLRCR